MRDLKSQAQGVEFGTSPHGLSADLLRTHQETGKPVNLPFLEDQQGEAAQDTLGGALTATERTAHGAGAPYAGESTPEVYRRPEVRSCCRSIKAAVLKQDPSVHRLAVDDCEFLHLYYAVEHDRSKMRKAIGKGLAVAGDLRATDSLWHKLQAVMNRRQYGSRS